MAPAKLGKCTKGDSGWPIISKREYDRREFESVVGPRGKNRLVLYFNGPSVEGLVCTGYAIRSVAFKATDVLFVNTPEQTTSYYCGMAVGPGAISRGGIVQ